MKRNDLPPPENLLERLTRREREAMLRERRQRQLELPLNQTHEIH